MTKLENLKKLIKGPKESYIYPEVISIVPVGAPGYPEGAVGYGPVLVPEGPGKYPPGPYPGITPTPGFWSSPGLGPYPGPTGCSPGVPK